MHSKLRNTSFAFAALLILSGCSSVLPSGSSFSQLFAPQQATLQTHVAAPIPLIQTPPSGAKNCLMRVMYFESNRSSASGMLAVGTVVMNRVNSPKFDNNICAVVGAPRQFAPGVLSREMTETTPVALANRVADKILAGERHSGVQTAKFFHTAGLTFPYTNMHYVLETGGLAFYIKRSRR